MASEHNGWKDTSVTGYPEWSRAQRRSCDPYAVGVVGNGSKDSAKLEQEAYRAGLLAGERKSEAQIGALKQQLKHAYKLASYWCYKCRGYAEKPVDLDRSGHIERAASDRAATQALVEREPWHAGLDPDDP